MHIFSTSIKDYTFSQEKVVIMQFDKNCWFYAPIYSKWLPLIRTNSQGITIIPVGHFEYF